ncbi:hypothetical protein SLEP1_g45286 [Rubroshorea leprosula]|uniref:Uncharacterized protein n=1 Tax=Rubroshorea leprosula TaxID=152421 RepID=A0AAV5LJC5_9ROSI|nr:hypothetical protein SLEP1_g45286 [Rubroshorea leprosula]
MPGFDGTQGRVPWNPAGSKNPGVLGSSNPRLGSVEPMPGFDGTQGQVPWNPAGSKNPDSNSNHFGTSTMYIHNKFREGERGWWFRLQAGTTSGYGLG